MCRLPRLLAVAAAGVLCTRTALAWDRDTHTAIVQAALRLSPAAAARVPPGYRDVVDRETQAPDLTDRECRYHALITGDRDAAKEAEKILDRLISGKGLEKGYTRAQALGRYAHFVADAMMPPDYAHDNARAAGEFFANKNFVLFREKQPLSRPLAPSLRARVAAARWGDPSDSRDTSHFRAAVNIMVDALLLAPPDPGETVPPDDGPVIFVVDRLDTGLGASRIVGYRYGGTVQQQLQQGSYGTYDKGVYSEVRKGDATKGKASFMINEKPGVQVVEWVEKKIGSGVANVRVLVFNNDDTCATKVQIKVPGSWDEGLTLPGVLGPRCLRVYEIDAPAGFARQQVARTWTPADCPAGADPGASSRRRVVVGNSGLPPVVDERVAETRVGK